MLLIWAPSWGWVIAANVLLGISQGLTWSTTVIMKIDLVGPARRGLAMGLNEAAGYGAVAATALATGYLAARYGLRPEPFYLGIAFAALGLGLSTLAVRETRDHARLEAGAHIPRADGRHEHLHAELTDRQVFAQTSLREPALSAASQAGLVNNLNDGLAWGLFPVLFAAAGLSVDAHRHARRPLPGGVGGRAARHRRLVGPDRSQAAHRHRHAHPGAGSRSRRLRPTRSRLWAVAAMLLGVGTAMVYPTLLAAVGDVAHPAWRARAVGVYRLWRDGGFAVGALLAGVLADAFGIRAAVWVVAALTAASGLVVAAADVRDPAPAASRTTSRVDRLTSRAGRRTFWAGGAMGEVEHRSRIDDLLADARADLDRVAPADLAAEMAAGALVVDTRPEEQRRRDGELPGAVVIDRNVLEWRLDPTSPHHIPDACDADRRVIVVCNEGFSSSLAAATLRRLGMRRATDLAGGYQAWLRRVPGPRQTLDHDIRRATEGAQPPRPGV